MAPSELVKLDYAQRREKKKKKVKLYFITQILFYFMAVDNEPCW